MSDNIWRHGDAELTFVEGAATAGPALLLDTTVYIDTLQGRLPPGLGQLLAARQINHSAVAVGELAHAFGRLDPAHPGTGAALDAVDASLC